VREEYLLRPLDTPPVYGAVVERVKRAVALGVLLPGDRLPAERAFAEGLGVSRVTVREALRVLQGEGMLVAKRGSAGTIVASSALAAVGGDPAMDEDRLREVFEVRLAVETTAARLAAERRDDAGLRALDACQEALEASREIHAFRRADSEFHLAIARMSGNAMIHQIVEDVRAAVFSQLDAQDFDVVFESSSRGHAAVTAAVRAGDADAAAAAMAAHLEEARTEVIAVLAARHGV
jgi:GntR family transcriptional regulator, transcriptional repressor for pyruvate dehydrogenase complex